ncbi:MAG: RlpA-like double-psi beta-barrel domain-containing protein [Xanthobacteraceae bacterium]
MLQKRSIFTALFVGAFVAALVVPASAGGWASVHRYVHKTGRCGDAREVLASFYNTGRLTATGERFNPRALTAASYDYVLGTTITVTNPHNGRTCQVRVNDHGPNGIARVMGARIDFALGARDCLGMVASQYVCAPDAHSVAQLHVREARHVVYIKTRHRLVASNDLQRVTRVKPSVQKQAKKRKPVFFATRTKW